MGNDKSTPSGALPPPRTQALFPPQCHYPSPSRLIADQRQKDRPVSPITNHSSRRCCSMQPSTKADTFVIGPKLSLIHHNTPPLSFPYSLRYRVFGGRKKNHHIRSNFLNVSTEPCSHGKRPSDVTVSTRQL